MASDPRNQTHQRRLARRLADAAHVPYSSALERVRIAARAGRLPDLLDAAGMDEAFRLLLEEVPRPGGPPTDHRVSLASPNLDGFTPRARDVVQRARSEAAHLGHAAVRPEHVLLAIFQEPASVGAKVLTDMNLTRATVEQRVLHVIPRGTPRDDTPPFAPETVACIDQARVEARQLAHPWVATEHIVLALLAELDGLAARLVMDAGGRHDDIHRRVMVKLAEHLGQTPRSA